MAAALHFSEAVTRGATEWTTKTKRQAKVPKHWEPEGDELAWSCESLDEAMRGAAGPESVTFEELTEFAMYAAGKATKICPTYRRQSREWKRYATQKFHELMKTVDDLEVPEELRVLRWQTMHAHREAAWSHRIQDWAKGTEFGFKLQRAQRTGQVRILCFVVQNVHVKRHNLGLVGAIMSDLSLEWRRLFL